MRSVSLKLVTSLVVALSKPRFWGLGGLSKQPSVQIPFYVWEWAHEDWGGNSLTTCSPTIQCQCLPCPFRHAMTYLSPFWNAQHYLHVAIKNLLVASRPLPWSLRSLIENREGGQVHSSSHDPTEQEQSDTAITWSFKTVTTEASSSLVFSGLAVPSPSHT